MEEIWKDIKGYEGLYKVSNLGKVLSLRSNKLLREIDHSGYTRITLSKDKKSINYLLHRLVANTFLENTENKPEVYHIDGNRKNNIITNLAFRTRKESIEAKFKNHIYKTVEEKQKYQRQYRENNKDKVQETLRQYRENNKEKIKESNRKYREKMRKQKRDSKVTTYKNETTKKIFIDKDTPEMLRSVSALKRYHMRTYKDFIFTRIKLIEKELNENNHNIKIDEVLEFPLLTEELFSKVYGTYKVVAKKVEEKKYILERVEPYSIILGLQRSDVPIYKGLPVLSEKDRFKIEFYDKAVK